MITKDFQNLYLLKVWVHVYQKAKEAQSQRVDKGQKASFILFLDSEKILKKLLL